MLPDIDGFEVLRRLHAAHVRIPSLIQSSLIGHDQKVEGLSLGVDDFLVKPFSRRELMDRIKSALERKRDAVEDRGQHHEMSERRGAPRTDSPGRREIKRTRTLKSGQIIYKNSNCVIDCLIMDLSKTGARLEAADMFDCPSIILLQVLHGPTYRCEVRWQSGKTLGVAFETDPSRHRPP